MVGAIDRYVRISRSALQQIRLYHLWSGLDQLIATPTLATHKVPTGYTEWASKWFGTVVSVGWDWAVIHGAIVLINPMEIRTNIKILAPDGTGESAMRTRMYLQEWIEKMNWRAAIEDVLPGR